MYVFSMGLAVLQEQCYFLHLSSYFAACAVFFSLFFLQLESLRKPSLSSYSYTTHDWEAPGLVVTMTESCSVLAVCILPVRLKNRQ